MPITVCQAVGYTALINGAGLFAGFPPVGWLLILYLFFSDPTLFMDSLKGRFTCLGQANWLSMEDLFTAVVLGPIGLFLLSPTTVIIAMKNNGGRLRLGVLCLMAILFAVGCQAC